MLDSLPLVLIVEDSQSLAEIYSYTLRNEQARVVQAATLSAARAAVAADPPAVVLLDLRLPDGDGTELLKEIKRADPDAAVIVITAHGSINGAVDAIRGGAEDFLVKPFATQRLLTTVRNNLERHRLSRLVRILSPTGAGDGFEGFVGTDASMQAVYRIVEQAAASTATVFITGESGTGKEVCAEAIHRRSGRAGGPFVAINCGAFPRDLIESEIFGHTRGAFTGATANREGAASRAHRGTLFLDEICDMDLTLQTRLLRFLQTGVVQKVGSDRPERVDVRFVCATNRDPMEEVRAGRFREDLYYRLHVLPIHLPPLRDRGDDAVIVGRHFLRRFAAEEGKRFQGFTAEAEALLASYPWPGNVRQLQNVVRNITVLHDGDRVGIEMLGPVLDLAQGRRADPRADESEDGIRPLDDLEREAIERAITLCEGNMTRAAQRLGISVKTIYRKRAAWSGPTAA